jgi:hypothetical protein
MKGFFVIRKFTHSGFWIVLFLMTGVCLAQDRSEDYCQAGYRLYAQKNYTQAIQYFNAALDANPRMWQAFQGLGNCYYAQGNKSQALTSYQRCLSLHPDNPGLATFTQQLREQVEKSGEKDKEALSKEERERILQTATGTQEGHMEIAPSAGIVLGTYMNMGFGAGGSVFYMFDSQFGLGGLVHLYFFNDEFENDASLEFIPSFKYKGGYLGLNPYLVGGAGFTVVMASSSSGGALTRTQSASALFPIIGGGAGLEYPINPETKVYVEGRLEYILFPHYSFTMLPVDAGLVFAF